MAILAAWALQETATNGDIPIYQLCQREAQNNENLHIKVALSNGSFVEVLDSSNYHCSLGMYTEEMKYAAEGRKDFIWNFLEKIRDSSGCALKTPKFIFESFDISKMSFEF